MNAQFCWHVDQSAACPKPNLVNGLLSRTQLDPSFVIEGQAKREPGSQKSCYFNLLRCRTRLRLSGMTAAAILGASRDCSAQMSVIVINPNTPAWFFFEAPLIADYGQSGVLHGCPALKASEDFAGNHLPQHYASEDGSQKISVCDHDQGTLGAVFKKSKRLVGTPDEIVEVFTV